MISEPRDVYNVVELLEEDKAHTQCTLAPFCNRRAEVAFLQFKEGSSLKKEHTTGREHPTQYSAEQDSSIGWRFRWPEDGLALERDRGKVAAFACRYHQSGIDSFWYHKYRRDGIEIPAPRFQAWDEHGSCVLRPDQPEAVTLDAAMRFLRKRRGYAVLEAVIPEVLSWGDDEKPPTIYESGFRIGWTDGYSRFELIHPRIIWGDEFRLVQSGGPARLQLAGVYCNHDETRWLGRFV